MKQLKSIGGYVFKVTTIVLSLSLISLISKAQKTMSKFIVNDEVVAEATIEQLEKTYRVTCVPGNYWYDRLTGAYGLQGGPCIGIGVAGLQIGGQLKSNASAGNTRVFINGRELHTVDVQRLQTFQWVLPGRYWMDVHSNYGWENIPVILGNVYQAFRSKFGTNNNPYNPNPRNGDIGSFAVDGSFMSYTVKKADGTSLEWSRD